MTREMKIPKLTRPLFRRIAYKFGVYFLFILTFVLGWHSGSSPCLLSNTSATTKTVKQLGTMLFSAAGSF